MPKEKGFKWKLGLFSTIALVLLVGAIYYIGKQKNKFGSVIRVSAVFNSVNGLKIGSNVRFGGINIGTVDDIALTTDTTVQVDMIIQKKVQKFIKKDAKANIGSDGLMGDKVIVLAPGSPSQPPIADNDVLQARTPIETEQLLATLKVSVDNAAVITTNLADISSRINNGEGALGKLLKDNTLATNISSTMKNLKKSSEGLSENMEAAKHNFLLKGYFKKKDREKKKKEEEEKKKADDQQKPEQAKKDKKSKN